MPKKKLYNVNGIVYSTGSDFNTEQKTAEDITLPVQEQLLKVRLDAKHRAGKMVTLIEGFSGSPGDLEQLARQLKSYCGTGGSVKDNSIIIQGDNRGKIFEWLNNMGYRKVKKL